MHRCQDMTERQRRFTDLYLNGPRKVAGNASKAAELAGYRWPSQQGARLLQFPSVGGAIRAEWKVRHEAFRRQLRAEDRARDAAIRATVRERGRRK
jgi:phage terminase small subunit